MSSSPSRPCNHLYTLDGQELRCTAPMILRQVTNASSVNFNRKYWKSATNEPKHTFRWERSDAVVAAAFAVPVAPGTTPTSSNPAASTGNPRPLPPLPSNAENAPADAAASTGESARRFERAGRGAAGSAADGHGCGDAACTNVNGIVNKQCRKGMCCPACANAQAKEAAEGMRVPCIVSAHNKRADMLLAGTLPAPGDVALLLNRGNIPPRPPPAPKPSIDAYARPLSKPMESAFRTSLAALVPPVPQSSSQPISVALTRRGIEASTLAGDTGSYEEPRESEASTRFVVYKATSRNDSAPVVIELATPGRRFSIARLPKLRHLLGLDDEELGGDIDPAQYDPVTGEWIMIVETDSYPAHPTVILTVYQLAQDYEGQFAKLEHWSDFAKAGMPESIIGARRAMPRPGARLISPLPLPSARLKGKGRAARSPTVDRSPLLKPQPIQALPLPHKRLGHRAPTPQPRKARKLSHSGPSSRSRPRGLVIDLCDSSSEDLPDVGAVIGTGAKVRSGAAGTAGAEAASDEEVDEARKPTVKDEDEEDEDGSSQGLEGDAGMEDEDAEEDEDADAGEDEDEDDDTDEDEDAEDAEDVKPALKSRPSFPRRRHGSSDSSARSAPRAGPSKRPSKATSTKAATKVHKKRARSSNSSSSSPSSFAGETSDSDIGALSWPSDFPAAQIAHFADLVREPGAKTEDVFHALWNDKVPNAYIKYVPSQVSKYKRFLKLVGRGKASRWIEDHPDATMARLRGHWPHVWSRVA